MIHTNTNINRNNGLVLQSSYWCGMPSVEPKAASKGDFRPTQLGVGYIN